MATNHDGVVGSIVIEKYELSYFEEIEVIGDGGEAIVYKGCWQGANFAMKVMKSDPLGISTSSRINISEAEILIKHSMHENIVRVYGLLLDDRRKQIGYVMEFMEYGSLHRTIHNAEINYDIGQVYSWIRQAANGLQYLHQHNIIHRDIKPANILHGSSLNNLKISDFGLARLLNASTIVNGTGTFNYMSPEVLKSETYSFPSDIYAFSVTIWEMVHRKSPAEMQDLDNIIETSKNFLLDTLLRRGRDADPNKRPDLSEFINFAQINLEQSDTSQILCVGTDPIQSSREQIKNSLQATQLVGSIVTPEYKFSEFKNPEIIGEGGEAIVFKGPRATDEKYFAIKMMNRMNTKEAELLIKHSKHENIVKVYGLLISEDPSKRRIGYVMEFMENGSLNRIIHNAEIKYTMRQFYLWISQAAEGLNYLHRNNIIHRDIKPANILIGHSLDDLKISDFGFAKLLNKDISSITGGIGTISYMSPEVIDYQKYSFPSDIYALSITIWEMFHRKRPYEEFADKSAYWISNQITENNKRPGDSFLNKLLGRLQINNNRNDSITNLTDISTADLLMRGWDADPNNRPDLSEFIKFARINLEQSDTSQILCVGTDPEIVQPSREQIKNSVMILGGLLRISFLMFKKFTDSICIFNLKQNKWNDLHLRLPHKLSGHGSVMINDEIYIFGGECLNEGEECLKELYKLGENMKWMQLTNMNEKRAGIGNSSVVFEDEIWVFGGKNEKKDDTIMLKTVEKYNPKSNTWTMMPEMKDVRAYAAASVINGKFYVSGGYKIWNHLKAIEVFDPKEKEWEIFCKMPFALWGHASVADGTNLIIIGGKKRKKLFQHETSNEVWKINVLDPEKKWIKMPNLQQPRINHGAVKLEDRLMVIGGAINYKTQLDSVEIFDGNKWTEGNKIPEKLSEFSLIQLTTKE